MAVNKSPNDLFLSWLQEWKNEAKSKESKMHYAYSKAMESMSRFPLTLSSGKECNILKGFGDKICRQLDAKLEKEMRNAGWESTAEAFIKEAHEKGVFTKIKLKPQRKSKLATDESTLATTAAIASISNGEEDTTSVLSDDTKNKKQRNKKLLNVAGLNAVSETIITSVSLPLSQKSPQTTTSVLVPQQQSPPQQPPQTTTSSLSSSNNHTATQDTSWFEYIQENGEGSVRKDKAVVKMDELTFSLGFLVKCKYLSLIMSGKQYDIDASRTANDDDFIYAFIHDKDAPEIISNNKTNNKDNNNNNNNNNHDNNTHNNSNAPTSIKDCKNVNKNNKHINKAKNSNKIRTNNNNNNVLTTTTTCNNISSPTTLTTSLSKEFMQLINNEVPCILIDDDDAYSNNKNNNNNIKSNPNININTNNNTNNSKIEKTKKATSIKRHASENNVLTDQTKKKIAKFKSVNYDRNALRNDDDDDEMTRVMMKGDKNIADEMNELLKLPCVRHIDNKVLVRVKDNGDGGDDANDDDGTGYEYQFTPYSFEIILCVDTREMNEGNSIVSDLTRMKTPFEVRHLHLGDFLWVVRNHDGVELVCDSIVERKRMNDLAGSVVDGRLKTQRLRLSRCGLNNTIFLIEGKVGRNFSISQTALQQNILNLQVTNGFGVKQVENSKQSAYYLAQCTLFLNSYYQDKTLYGYKTTRRDLNNAARKIQKLTYGVHLSTFESFNSENMKSKKCSVSEMFTKMLIQLKGVSLPRASSIVATYPTPFALYKAYEACSGEDERIKLLAKLTWGPSKKNIGLALSKLVANTYYAKK